MNHLLPVPNLVQSLTIQPWAKKIKKGLSGRSRRGSSLPTANNFHNKHPYLKYYLCISKFFMIFMIPLKKTGQPMLPMKKTSLKWTHFFQQLSKFKCTPPTYVQFHLENPHRNPNTSSFQGRKVHWLLDLVKHWLLGASNEVIYNNYLLYNIRNIYTQFTITLPSTLEYYHAHMLYFFKCILFDTFRKWMKQLVWHHLSTHMCGEYACQWLKL